MTHDEAEKQLGCECPRKIMAFLHGKGIHVHGTTARFPGKVLCFHKDSPRPDDWVPTAAQTALWSAAHQQRPPAAHG